MSRYAFPRNEVNADTRTKGNQRQADSPFHGSVRHHKLHQPLIPRHRPPNPLPKNIHRHRQRTDPQVQNRQCRKHLHRPDLHVPRWHELQRTEPEDHFVQRRCDDRLGRALLLRVEDVHERRGARERRASVNQQTRADDSDDGRLRGVRVAGKPEAEGREEHRGRHHEEAKFRLIHPSVPAREEFDEPVAGEAGDDGGDKADGAAW